MKKKVLLSLPKYSSYYLPLKEAFEDLGYTVLFFDYRHGDFVTKLIRLFKGHEAAIKFISKKILEISIKEKVDFVLVVKGEVLSPQLLKALKRNKIKTVNWFPDPLNWWDFMVKMAPYYTYFLHFDPLVVRRLKKRLKIESIRYLPFAAEISDITNTTGEYKISFIGTYSKFREEYLFNIAKMGLNICGDKRWFHSKLNKYVQGGRISQRKMKEIIQKSLINVNLHFDADREGTNLRTFEVTGSGGFLLVEYVKDLRRLFSVNNEVVSFNSPRDLKNKVTRYLKDDKQRLLVSKNGFRRVLKSHTYKTRVKQMLDIVI